MYILVTYDVDTTSKEGGSPFTMCGQGMFGLWTEGAELSL